MSGRKLTAQEEQSILRAAARGLPCKTIAREYGYDPGTVRKILKKNREGIDKPTDSNTR